MIISRRDCWLVLAAVLLGVGLTFAAGALFGLAPQPSDGLLPLGGLSAWLLGVLLGPPLLLLLTALAARLGLDSGPATRAKGELDRLLRRKRQGLLPQGPRWLRDSATGSDRRAPAASRAAEAAPEIGLDRLVWMKRWKAWAACCSEAITAGRADHGVTEGCREGQFPTPPSP